MYENFALDGGYHRTVEGYGLRKKRKKKIRWVAHVNGEENIGKRTYFCSSRKVIGERFRSLQCEWTEAGRSAHN